MDVLSKVPGFCNGKGFFKVKRKAYVPVLLTYFKYPRKIRHANFLKHTIRFTGPAKLWNVIPRNIRSSPTLSAFKKSLT